MIKKDLKLVELWIIFAVQLVFDAVRKFIRMRQELADLPNLIIRQGSLKTRHPRKANSILDYPEGLAYWILGHTFAFEKLRRFGEHALGDAGHRLAGQAMAHGAILAVDSGAAFQVGFTCIHGRLLIARLGQDGLQRAIGEKFLEGDRLRIGSNRGESECEIAIGTYSK